MTTDVQMMLNGRDTARVSSTPPELAELLDATMKLAVVVARGGKQPDRKIRAELRRVCALAVRSGLRAEELVLILKGSWRGLPDVPAIPRMDADAFLARLVTICIEEFYSEQQQA